MSELKELVRSFLEHAPPFDPSIKQVTDLIGWNIKGEFVCAACANRLFQRGCWKWSGRESSPVWFNHDPFVSGTPNGPCVGCE